MIFASDPLEVRRALQDTLSRLRPLLPRRGDRAVVELVLAEVLNNIVEHAYAGGAGPIELIVRPTRRGLACIVLDEGAPMPGGRLPPGGPCVLVPARPARDLPEGGYGWPMIRRLCHELRYLREAERNRLSFEFRPERFSGSG